MFTRIKPFTVARQRIGVFIFSKKLEIMALGRLSAFLAVVAGGAVPLPSPPLATAEVSATLLDEQAAVSRNIVPRPPVIIIRAFVTV